MQMEVIYTEFSEPKQYWQVAIVREGETNEVVIGNIAHHDETGAVVFVPVPGFMFGHQILLDISKKIESIENA